MDPRFSRRNEYIVLVGLIFAYVSVLGFFSLLRHYNFASTGWDLGIFNQIFWNTTNGHPFESTISSTGSDNHLGKHFTPFLLLLLPGYAIFSSIDYLLIIQTIALGVAAWPLYFFARDVLKNRLYAFSVVLAYFLYPALHGVNTYDFHIIPFAIPLFFSAFYFYAKKQWRWLFFFLLLAMTVREDIVLLVLFFGIFMVFRSGPLFSRSTWRTVSFRLGVGIALLSLAYFIFVDFAIIPLFGGSPSQFEGYEYLGSSAGDAVFNILHDPFILFSHIFIPLKFVYLYFLFFPVALLPFLSFSSLLVLAPGLFENLLSTNYHQYSIGLHYSALVIPGIFLGVVYGLKRLLYLGFNGKKLFFLFIPLAITVYHLPPGYSLSFYNHAFSNPQREEMAFVTSLVPDNVHVAASAYFAPRLSYRRRIQTIGGEVFSQPDIILLDLEDPFGFNERVLSFDQYVAFYKNNSSYTLEEYFDRYLIFTKVDS
ncbi:MAG: hypothetical protein COU08_01580 [Candidatus Harrisonbacteria bacterium CG10_big_fil_rev_8_21_14_0_10_42_17]|uniref:DUF2079 domain-containing protein n=1 Tax=Candidatus Harrisonbacteria bacterium CG10_big_fil_rev_8_21_14_0_10_42_17 TaxID=1974584 RepID=A0A2M6WIP3_9BACT|nr:MAG: hypothetical protein COU08_01580 [Candidatus Harrisonbacteria bacterium CG10_big_fil_rev_8_21_14_0_10_42_17]